MTIEIIISVVDQEVKEILIATLSEIGFSGFEEEEKCLKCYVAEVDFDEIELNRILNERVLNYSLSRLEEVNWNETWEKNFSPVIVGNFCSIRADFHAPTPNVAHEIVITPKMSFGTGHHATTYLMIEQMQYLDFIDRSVADFGTGTGVLSILAEKLGAGNIWALDIDDWSIDNAKENFERNSCSKVILEKKDTFNTLKTFDVILANINRNVILENLVHLTAGLKRQRQLLLSGLLINDEKTILEAAFQYNLIKVKTVEKDGWISILLTFLT